MAKLIFEEVWCEPQYISVWCVTMFLMLYNQVNASDVVNKSSVSSFIIY